MRLAVRMKAVSSLYTGWLLIPSHCFYHAEFPVHFKFVLQIPNQLSI